MKKAILTAVLILLAAAALLFLIPVVFFGIALNRPDVTDPAKYEKTLRRLHYSTNEEIAHFPAEIPEGAEGVEFRYSVGVLQGGDLLSLSFTAEPALFERLRDELVEEAFRCSGEVVPDPGLYRSHLPESFPIETAKVLVFRGRPYMPESWNHGTYSLALLSEEGRQIVFLWERW